MKQLTKNILKEYKLKSVLYEEFAHAISSLLEIILKENGYKYYIHSRLKEDKSLETKIERKKLKGKIYKNLTDIKDIAGVRIIFYTESDRKKFIKKIKKEFGESLQIKKNSKLSGYTAVHAILSFGKDRLKLAEYKAFKGLECEIQLSLILEHAWAEIEHDILYKESWGFKEHDRLRYLLMKEKMARIMRNHINQASTELEKVVLQSNKIKRENDKVV